MALELQNLSDHSMPRLWMGRALEFIFKELRKRKIISAKDQAKELDIVFLNPAEAKKLNKKFRNKNYPTDILSFAGDQELFGELVICPQVLEKQAKEHGHSFKAELGYMLIHGVLHLLGYDHEKSKKEAQKMFQIQDQVFDRLCDKFKL
jgi:probable rRNA maturation factor